MATTAERVSVLETKLENTNEKLDDIKFDVKEVHDCLDRTGESLHAALKEMTEDSTQAHAILAEKISNLENFRKKWTYLIMGGLAAGGWLAGHTTALGFFIK